MTQQPFTRRGAIDLSALKRPASPPPGPAGGAPAGAGAEGGATPTGAYTVQVTAQSLQDVAEASMTAPVLLVVYSASRSPESATYAADVASLVEAYEGRFLAGLVDLDTAPEVGQALQITQVPVLLVLLDGRPVTQPIPGVVPADELSALLNQLGQQLTAQGVSGRHQPLAPGAPADGVDDDGEPASDPRYAAAEDALARDDIDTAVAEYQRLVDANPADHGAAAGLAMAKVIQRAYAVDPAATRAAADAAPADVDAQTLAADVDLVEGRVEEAFARLVELVRVTAEKERDRAREHLIGLFAAVGNDDQRVLAARRNLASALF